MRSLIRVFRSRVIQILFCTTQKTNNIFLIFSIPPIPIFPIFKMDKFPPYLRSDLTKFYCILVSIFYYINEELSMRKEKKSEKDETILLLAHFPSFIKI